MLCRGCATALYRSHVAFSRNSRSVPTSRPWKNVCRSYSARAEASVSLQNEVDQPTETVTDAAGGPYPRKRIASYHRHGADKAMNRGHRIISLHRYKTVEIVRNEAPVTDPSRHVTLGRQYKRLEIIGDEAPFTPNSIGHSKHELNSATPVAKLESRIPATDPEASNKRQSDTPIVSYSVAEHSGDLESSNERESYTPIVSHAVAEPLEDLESSGEPGSYTPIVSHAVAEPLANLLNPRRIEDKGGDLDYLSRALVILQEQHILPKYILPAPTKFSEKADVVHRYDTLRSRDRPASRKWVLASYIQAMSQVVPRRDLLAVDFRTAIWPHHEQIASYLSKADLPCLALEGHDATDLFNWATILLSRRPGREIIEGMTRPPLEASGPSRTRVPVFVLLAVLRRRKLHPDCIWDILQYVSAAFDDAHALHKSDPSATRTLSRQNRATEILGKYHMLLIIGRLLRHARQVHTTLLSDIAGLLCRHLDFLQQISTPQVHGPPVAQALQTATFLCNKVLNALAITPTTHPLRDSFAAENAQFTILERMAGFAPPLIVTSEGYKAVIAVLLRRPKTERERDWAAMKKGSWPPWKEDRTGLDEYKNAAYGTSRAGAALLRMKEAGCDTGEWGMLAHLFAGWDTDNTPTMQVRAKLPNTDRKLPEPDHSIAVQTGIWAARITATRTLNEAWASFLAFKSSGTYAPSLSVTGSDVYEAMLRKIVAQENAKIEKSNTADFRDPAMSSQSIPLPGDGIELSPEPASTHEWTYVSAPPPSSNELVGEMIAKVRVSKKCAQFILVNVTDATRLQSLLELLFDGSRINEIIWSSRPEHQMHWKEVPLPAIKCVIAALCRVPAVKGISDVIHGPSVSNICPPLRLRSQHPVVHALHLSAYYPHSKKFVYAMVLRCLEKGNNTKDPVGIRDHPRSLDKIYRVALARHAAQTIAVEQEPLDLPGFSSICNILQAAIIPSHDLLRWLETHDAHERMSEQHPAIIETAQWILDHGSFYIRELFYRAVGQPQPRTSPNPNPSQRPVSPRSPTPTLSRLYTIPDPADLHRLIRTLASFADHEGLLSIVYWMAEHHTALSEITSNSVGGRRRFRTLLVAIRVWLERPAVQMMDHRNDYVKVLRISERFGRGVPDEAVLMARETVEGVEGWGGWPAWDEVVHYINRSGDIGPYPNTHDIRH
ncbi:hypothetical protein P152DRAFT_515759 [Eremomyces bilateralis CBS 781.70]|uniref:Uncharacterized protein n=1 Tax=Eremomyces bilateralis CBS 781.70 TaxID=1392243 RepID=A0A6G1FXV4_9PEZI|nr:uncharacterized protein P152DRAFT_515759 [Eremomyces bilateralis CBS 781.70]KAF1810588.1 hypothetical protein P152DRAFT_515759 [Eremomyces bilateralis CBS 781.70]